MSHKKYAAAVGIILMAVLAGGVFWGWRKEETILELGMFTGSNWDVDSTNSFVIMDKAIADFEDSHPGIKIHYSSGILKEDYGEWCAGKLLEGSFRMYLWCWIQILASIVPWEL